MDIKLTSRTKIYPAPIWCGVYLLFFLSGISGLIYETVWLRILIRVLGSTVYATSTVLASFMAGMAIGSYIFGKIGDRTKNLLRLFAYLEVGIGVSALLLAPIFKILTPLYRPIYSILGQERFVLTIFQSSLMFFLLLIPASLMGGTLPVLAGHTRKYQVTFSQRLGYLYGLNTLGACIGVIASGIYTIGAWGESSTLFIAVVMNLLVSLVALSMSKINDSLPAKDIPEVIASTVSQYDDPTRRKVLIAYASSGFAAMSYEIVWTRMFQIQIGTSIYAFSMMLAFYLLGVALGSVWAALILAKSKNPLTLFGISQLFIAFYSILGMYLFTLFKPALIVGFFQLKNMLLMPATIIFPITFILGLVFPAASQSYVKNENQASSAVGRIYSFNTLGCILGSLVCGFIFIGLLGTKNTILILAAINILIGITILYRIPASIRNYRLNIVTAGFLVCVIILGFFSPDPFRNSMQRIVNFLSSQYNKDFEIYYYKEAVAATSTVLGVKEQPLTRNLWINGIGISHLCLETKLMAHLPILLHGSPKDLLVICFGMGTTLRSAWLNKSLRCDTVELVPEAYECFKYFYRDGPGILLDPRINHYVDDGRNFLLMRAKKYDIITVDPSPPIWSQGTVNLYSKEFLQLARDRLNPQGIMCMWVPPTAFSEVLMIMKTFQEVFPNTLVFRGQQYSGLFLLGFNNQRPYRLENLALLSKDQQEVILKDLNERESIFPDTESILNLFMLNSAQLARFVEGERVITDDHPYTEFPLWRSIFDDTFKITLDANVLSILKEKMFKK